MTEIRTPKYLAYHFLWCLLDWVFPPICGGCDRTGDRWCPVCQETCVKITGAVCPSCGLPLLPSGACPDCLAQQPAFHTLRSWGVYGGALRKAILRLKYQKDMGMGEALSKHLIELYNDLKWEVDFVVPVPLSKAHYKKRGYNQAGLLALPLAYAVRKPYLPGILERTRDTLSQVHLGAQERRQNVSDAFRAKAEIVKGKKILVIDDVTTTGSTISACAKALNTAGASAVFGMTLARSVLQADVDDQPT